MKFGKFTINFIDVNTLAIDSACRSPADNFLRPRFYGSIKVIPASEEDANRLRKLRHHEIYSIAKEASHD
jgi:hypothetical protein